MDLNTMIYIERLQRTGASEEEIVRAVEEIEGIGRSSRNEPFWRRLGSVIFVS
jgi:hypothetical protein